MLSRDEKIDRMFGLNLNCKSVVKTVFGGEDDSAQKAQIKQNAAATALIAEKGEEAAEIANQLFPASDVNRNLGLQAALDVIGQSAPQQFSAFQQGNVGAQQALLSGQQQVQNAILGLPASLSGMQPQAVQFDPGFLQQQLPDFITSPQAMGQELNQFQGIRSTIQDALGGAGFGKRLQQPPPSFDGVRMAITRDALARRTREQENEK
jgi:hypothetical protein